MGDGGIAGGHTEWDRGCEGTYTQIGEFGSGWSRRNLYILSTKPDLATIVTYRRSDYKPEYASVKLKCIGLKKQAKGSGTGKKTCVLTFG